MKGLQEAWWARIHGVTGQSQTIDWSLGGLSGVFIPGILLTT